MKFLEIKYKEELVLKNFKILNSKFEMDTILTIYQFDYTNNKIFLDNWEIDNVNFTNLVKLD